MELKQLEEILLTLAYKEENKIDSQKAFEIIYREYSKFLFTLVRRNIKQMGVIDEQIISTTVNNTFIKIYDKPLNFKIRENETNDNCFKAWLSVVAKNELRRLFTEYYKTNLVLVENILETVFYETEISFEFAESVNTKLMQDALATLNERDGQILCTIYLYYEEGKKTPTAVLDTICQKFGTTRDNIRQIKKRSEAKIIEYFSKYSQLKSIKNVG